jgi:L-ascorbate metabolism protein UlaG (beta-lactamase superfamily)
MSCAILEKCKKRDFIKIKKGAWNMARITYHGHSMFEIESDNGTKIITYPYNEKIKNILPDVSGDIVLVSHDHFDHDNVSIIGGDPTIIKNSVPTHLKGIAIEGIDSFHDTKNGELRGRNIIFKFVMDGIVFVHLGDLGHNLNKSQIEKLSGTDVLMIPVGGTYTVNFLEASDIVKKIMPGIAIPMHYKEPDSKLDVDRVEPFLSRWQNFERKGHSVSISKDELEKHKGNLKIWVFDSN